MDRSSRATPTRSKRCGASTGGEIQRGTASFGCPERAEAIAVGAIRFAAGMVCSKSTAPGVYGRREIAGAATQARVVTSPKETPISSRLRTLTLEHIAARRVSVPAKLRQIDREALLRPVAAIGVAEVPDHVEDRRVVGRAD